MTKYTVKATTQFKKDYKLSIKRGLKIDLLEQIVANLADGTPLVLTTQQRKTKTTP